MIVICDWTKRNTARLSHLRKVRSGRGLDPMAPAVLDGYSSNSSSSAEFLHFAALLGRLRDAEAFWHRVNEYCSSKCAQTGHVIVSREQFGRVVLSRDTDPVGQAQGAKVYDALIESGLAAPLAVASRDGTSPHAVPSQDGGCDGTAHRPVSAQKGRRRFSDLLPKPGACDGTTPKPVTAHEPPAVTAQAPALAQAGAQAGDARGRSRVTPAREDLSLEPPPCDGTSAGPRPDQTRKTSDAIPAAEVKRLEFELRAIEVDPNDLRKAEARFLRTGRGSRRDEAWLDDVGTLLAKPRTAKAVGMERQVSVG
jgi:hypothetical protein